MEGLGGASSRGRRPCSHPARLRRPETRSGSAQGRSRSLRGAERAGATREARGNAPESRRLAGEGRSALAGAERASCARTGIRYSEPPVVPGGRRAANVHKGGEEGEHALGAVLAGGAGRWTQRELGRLGALRATERCSGGASERCARPTCAAWAQRAMSRTEKWATGSMRMRARTAAGSAGKSRSRLSPATATCGGSR